MKRKEFIFVYALIVLLVVLLTIDVKPQTKIEILVTSDMVLFSVDFQSTPAPENKIVKIYLFYYKNFKFDKILVYGGNSVYQGYIFYQQGNFYWKDNTGYIIKYDARVQWHIPMRI